MYTLENFENSVKTIKLDGFQLEKDIQSYAWLRALDTRTERVGVGFRSYSGSFYTYTPLVSVEYNEIEKILKPLFEKYNVKQICSNYTIISGLENLKDINYKIFDDEVKDEKSFGFVAEEIKKIMELGALPFFEKYNTLEKVFEATEVMPIEEMANFIGQPLPLRRMLIKKLCHNPRYEEYANMVIDYYKSENNPDAEIAEALHAELSTR